MTTIKTLLKQWFSAIFMLSALALAACGPGTGGTGTGPIHFSSAASFVSSAGSQAMNPNTSAAPQTCGGANTQALNLLLQQNQIELSSPCGTFSFAGAWMITAAGEAEIVGRWQTSPPSLTQSATLKLSFVGAPDSSPAVRLTLQDSAGRILIGPVDLLRKPS